MSKDHYDYERAEEELGLAQHAAHPAAVKAHYELANRYLDRFYHDGEEGPQAGPDGAAEHTPEG